MIKRELQLQVSEEDVLFAVSCVEISIIIDLVRQRSLGGIRVRARAGSPFLSRFFGSFGSFHLFKVHVRLLLQ